MATYDKNSKFFWLQLREDFFDEDAISWLEEQPNGEKYSLFYLKLCLKALKSDGILIRKVGEMLIPYDQYKLAEITRTDTDTVIVAMELLKQIGLIRILENGEIYIPQLENLIGSQSKGAFKKQQQRKLGLISGQGGQKVDKGVDNCPPNIELEIELEKEIDKEIDIDNIVEKKLTADDVLKYLNEKTGKRFTAVGDNLRLINGRIREGRTFEDFKKVIDIKTTQWLNDPKMKQYLRPCTLFCPTKFDSYLNESFDNNLPSWYEDYDRGVKNEVGTSKSVEVSEEQMAELNELFNFKEKE